MAADKRDRTRRPDRDRQKHKLLSHKTPASARGISGAAVIKDESVFFLCGKDGTVPWSSDHGLGLFYHDCRYLSGYEFRVEGKALTALTHDVERGSIMVLEATNPDLKPKGRDKIDKEAFGVRLHRLLDRDELSLHERFTFTSYTLEPLRLEFSLRFRADFADVFEVRGMMPRGQRGPVESGAAGSQIHLCRRGADGAERRLVVRFAPEPDQAAPERTVFTVELEPRGTWELHVEMRLSESGEGQDGGTGQGDGPQPRRPSSATTKRAEERHQAERSRWTEGATRFASDSELMSLTVHRALQDMFMLRSRLDDKSYFAAGIPWFGALFGRDSIVTALQSMAFLPQVPATTLRLLAQWQGTKVDDYHDEEPGKILHELRRGPLARARLIPHTPYYGSVDATLLFLILCARETACSGSLDLFRELRPNIDAALRWMDEWADHDGDGYIDYHSPTKGGLANQGWKDSGNAIVNADGSLARPPIALVEVQAYAYRARLEIAALLRRLGEGAEAERLEAAAGALKERFNRDFWLPEQGCFALARQKGGEPVAVVTSNPGHALWAGAVRDDLVGPLVDRLFAEDMFSGWGVRTLAASERAYNPVGYHLGTVWPHDNSLIAAGLRENGRDEEALRIVEGLFAAAQSFPGFRLPELFSGFGRDDFRRPVVFPVACHPQAWGSGAILSLVQTLLGLHADALNRRLVVRRPLLPRFARWVELRRLGVGDAQVDLRFTRQGDGPEASLEVMDRRGEVEIATE